VPDALALRVGVAAVAIVLLDAGHNGANDASITRQVADGRGGNVVLRIRARLNRLEGNAG
jgi:N-acetylmuramoyl-L-alanine amidase